MVQSSPHQKPAPFPRALVEFFLKAFTAPGHLAFDPFLGSGTTIAAAHVLGRVGYGCEISPEYCDVVLQRMMHLTGETAVLADTGQQYAAAAQERGVNGAIDDFTVKTEIERAYLQTNPLIQQRVTTTVYNGRVMLTGRVDRPEMKAEAKRVASAVAGVRALYDEIEVTPAEGAWAASSPVTSATAHVEAG